MFDDMCPRLCSLPGGDVTVSEPPRSRQMETLIFSPPSPLSILPGGDVHSAPGNICAASLKSAISRIRANFDIWHISRGVFYCTVGPSVLIDRLEFNAHVTGHTVISSVMPNFKLNYMWTQSHTLNCRFSNREKVMNS